MIANIAESIPGADRVTRQISEAAESIPRPISSRVHAVLDYITVGAFLALPRVLGAKPAVTSAVTALALGKLAYTLMTDHEGGLIKRIPLGAHLALDGIAGAGMAAVPFLFDEDNDAVTWSLAGMGLFDILAAPMTQTDAYLDRQATACWAGFSPLIEE
jgi:hypothetical protein